MGALFAWLISHQPTVLFSQNKPARTSQRCSSLRTNQHQPSATSQRNRLGDCSRRGSSRLTEAYERFDNSAIQADDLRG
jgi:hypothetical protein